jgi:ribosomal-protein-alanine N-acetyltransferase
MKLVPLHLDYLDALFDFETENKSWFEQWVPARPSAYAAKESLTTVIAAQVKDMNSGGDLMFLLMDGDTLVGRFNLVVSGDRAEVGYRVSARFIGEGCASLGLQQLIEQAQLRGLKTLTAVTTFENIASTVVLKKLNFQQVGKRIEAAELNGRKVDLVEFELAL